MVYPFFLYDFSWEWFIMLYSMKYRTVNDDNDVHLSGLEVRKVWMTNQVLVGLEKILKIYTTGN